MSYVFQAPARVVDNNSEAENDAEEEKPRARAMLRRLLRHRLLWPTTLSVHVQRQHMVSTLK